MISLEEVKKLSLLARIELGKNEAEKLQKDLETILDYVAVLQKADLKEISETEIKSDEMREDEVLNNFTTKPADLISASPDIQNGYVRTSFILSSKNNG